MRSQLSAVVILSLCLAAPSFAAELPAEFAVDLSVAGALPRPKGEASDVWLMVRRESGRWQTVVGLAARFNSSFVEGRVAGAEVAPDRISLDLQVSVPSDAWVPGGYAETRVELRRQEGVRWTGTHTGFMGTNPISGAVQADLHPASGASVVAPPAPREHPRLVCRAADLPALKARIETPFGKAAVERFSNASGLGFRFMLTGDKALADQSRAEVERMMADSSSGDKSVRHRVWAWRCEAVALAYDMCYPAWDEAFRRKVEDYLCAVADRHWYDHGSFTEYIRWYVLDRVTPGLLYGPSLAAIALRGESGPAPAQPPMYLNGLDPASVLPPGTNVAADAGLPINPFVSDALPEKWVCVGGLKPTGQENPLAALGGAAAARPGEGSTVTGGGKTLAFAALDKAKHVWEGNLDLTAIAEKAWFSDVYAFAVIENDKERWVKFETGFSGGIRNPAVYLAGVRMTAGDVFKLGAGRYPFFVVAPIAETNPWGKIFARPRLIELSDADAQVLLKPVLAEAKFRQQVWQDAVAYQKETGASPLHEKNFQIGRALMYAVVRHAVRDGGFQAGAGFPSYQLEGVARYARCYAGAYGRSFSPFPDIAMFLPRTVQAHVYPADAAPRVQHLNGNSDFEVDDYQESRSNAAEFFACLYPLAPDAWKPALLWTWNRHLGIAGPDQTPLALKSLGKRNYDYGPYDPLAVYAFCTYPLDVKPEEPAGRLPLTWNAPGLGYHTFRNAWKDGDDFVFQAFAKTWSSQSWEPENAGAIRLAGLGQEWIPTVIGSERFREHVLQLPEDFIHNRDARGRMLDRWEEADGSGGLTMDLADVYAAAARDESERAQPLYSGYGDLRFDSNFVQTDRRGLRAVAVDYSGKCGAPCLLAVVDTFAGGNAEAQWALRLESMVERYGRWKVRDDKGQLLDEKDIPKATFGGKTDCTKYSLPREAFVCTRDPKVSEQYEPKVDDKSVSIDGKAFVLTKGDASMRGTFVAPESVVLTKGAKSEVVPVRVGHGQGVVRYGSYAVAAKGDNAYFCVLTVQRGEAPVVKVDGQGLNATVTVGSRQVRFDGKRIRFGSP